MKIKNNPDFAITAIHVSSQEMDYNTPISIHLSSHLILIENYRKFAQNYIDNSKIRLPNDDIAIKKRQIVTAALSQLNNVDNGSAIRINEFRAELKKSLDDISLSMRNDSTFMYLLKCVGVLLSGGLAYSMFFGKEATKGGQLLKAVESDVVIMADPLIKPLASDTTPSESSEPPTPAANLPRTIFIGDPVTTYGEHEDKKTNSERYQKIKELLLQFPDVTENNFRESDYRNGMIFDTKGTPFEIHFCESSI